MKERREGEEETYSDCAHVHRLCDYVKVVDEAEALDVHRLVEGPRVFEVSLGEELLQQLIAVL